MKKALLFSEFPEISQQQWIDQINSELKNQSVNDLNWKLKGLEVSPFKHKDTSINQPSIIARSNNKWLIGEHFEIKNYSDDNKIILDALMNGVNCPQFIFEELPSQKDLDVLFKGIDLTIVSFVIGGAPVQKYPVEMAKMLKEWWKTHFDNAPMKGTLNLSNTIHQETLDTLFQVFEKDEFNICCISSIPFYTVTENVVQELKEILQLGTNYLASNQDVKMSNQKLTFEIGIDQSYFINIAKIRAFKILWANVLKAHGVTDIHMPTISATFVKDAYQDDHYTNMIRATTMAMSAIVGGLDLLTVTPSDLEDYAFAKRVSRNLNHVLSLESHFDHVIDPAAGSYYVEGLTKDIAEAVWKSVQTVGDES